MSKPAVWNEPGKFDASATEGKNTAEKKRNACDL